ncbi:MAG: response regulator [Chloroflexota bacterium]
MTQSTKKPLALIVEDDISLMKIFQTCVTLAGFEAVVADDGAKALDVLTELVPDLFILDLHIPIYSGDEVLKHIKGDSRFESSRIIIESADARMADQLRDQVDFTVDKPVSARQLTKLVQRLIPTTS